MRGSSAWQSLPEAFWLEKLQILESDSVHQKVLSPGLGQKAGFWNLDGYKMDNVLAIRRENGNVHTNFFMRIQP